MNEANKFDCCISLGWKGLLVANTLAQVKKKIKFCEYENNETSSYNGQFFQ